MNDQRLHIRNTIKISITSVATHNGGVTLKNKPLELISQCYSHMTSHLIHETNRIRCDTGNAWVCRIS